jgi:hypothetical protein
MLDLLGPGLSYSSYWTNGSEIVNETFPEGIEFPYTADCQALAHKRFRS